MEVREVVLMVVPGLVSGLEVSEAGSGVLEVDERTSQRPKTGWQPAPQEVALEPLVAGSVFVVSENVWNEMGRRSRGSRDFVDE